MRLVASIESVLIERSREDVEVCQPAELYPYSSVAKAKHLLEREIESGDSRAAGVKKCLVDVEEERAGHFSAGIPALIQASVPPSRLYKRVKPAAAAISA